MKTKVKRILFSTFLLTLILGLNTSAQESDVITGWATQQIDVDLSSSTDLQSDIDKVLEEHNKIGVYINDSLSQTEVLVSWYLDNNMDGNSDLISDCVKEGFLNYRPIVDYSISSEVNSDEMTVLVISVSEPEKSALAGDLVYSKKDSAWNGKTNTIVWNVYKKETFDPAKPTYECIVSGIGAISQDSYRLQSMLGEYFDIPELGEVSKALVSFKMEEGITLNTSITELNSMFSIYNAVSMSCIKNELETIALPSSFNTVYIKDMSSMFSECSKLIELDVSNFDTSNVTSMDGMFYNCSGLQTLDLSNFDTSNMSDMSYMFYHCSGLTSLDVSHFNTSNVTNMYCMFYKCSGLQTLDLSNFDTSNVTNMSYIFYRCVGMTSLDVSNFNTSNVTNMSYMFYKCVGRTSLDVSNFDTSNVTSMDGMFYNCSGLQTLDLSNFDTSNVTNMSGMFSNCSGLTSLDLTTWDTSKVKDFNSFVENCRNMESFIIDSSFDTSSAEDMSSMFMGCIKLKDIDLSLFNTSSAQDISYMFSNCQSIEVLDLSGFDFSSLVETDEDGDSLLTKPILELYITEDGRSAKLQELILPEDMGIFSSCTESILVLPEHGSSLAINVSPINSWTVNYDWTSSGFAVKLPMRYIVAIPKAVDIGSVAQGQEVAINLPVAAKTYYTNNVVLNIGLSDDIGAVLSDFMTLNEDESVCEFNSNSPGSGTSEYPEVYKYTSEFSPDIIKMKLAGNVNNSALAGDYNIQIPISISMSYAE